MPQRFRFISFDKREYILGGRLTRIFGDSYRLPYRIAKPKIPPILMPTDHEGDWSRQQNVLTKLPEEILLDILDCLDPWHVLVLGFTCRRLWEVGWPYVQDRVCGSWRGTRLICEGDENPPAHLPPRMLSPAEFEEFSAEIHESNPEWLTPGPATLYNWMRARGKQKDMLDVHGSYLGYLFDRASCPLPKSVRSQARKLFHHDDFVEFFSPEANWTLRNLTKKAFVRGKTLNAAFHSTPSTGLELPSPDFGDVLVSQILWSKSPHSSVGLNCGDWAGDRFECLTDEDHDLAVLSARQTWINESDRIIETLARALRHLEDSVSDDDVYDKRHPPNRGRKGYRLPFARYNNKGIYLDGNE